MTNRVKVRVSKYLPAVFLLPLLTAKIPVTIHGAREIAGYFQALAIARTGFTSFSYLTPEESLTALHLHSLLSSPFIAMGYLEGGRLVSLLAAITATTLVSYLGYRYAGNSGRVLAPALLWAHPMFIRHAWAFQPDSLSIALTTGAIVAFLKYTDTDDNRLFYCGVALLVLGMTNHMWEATILLPLVTILAVNREYRKAGGTIAAAIAGAAIINRLLTLQARSQKTLFSHGTQKVGLSTFFTPEFWLTHFKLYYGFPSPNSLAITATLPLAVGVCLYYLYTGYLTKNTDRVILATWLASGLSIPFLMARGYMVHYYYLWAVLAPLAVALAQLLQSAFQQPTLSNRLSMQTATSIVCAALLAVSIAYIVVFQLGAFGGTSVPVLEHVEGERYHVDESVQVAAETVRTSEVDSEEVAFAGSFEKDYTRRAGRIAVYGGILPTHRHMASDGGPVLRQDPATTCESVDARILISDTGSSVRVVDCSG